MFVLTSNTVLSSYSTKLKLKSLCNVNYSDAYNFVFCGIDNSDDDREYDTSFPSIHCELKYNCGVNY